MPATSAGEILRAHHGHRSRSTASRPGGGAPVLRLRGPSAGRRSGSAARRGPPRRRGHRPAAGEVPALRRGADRARRVPSAARRPTHGALFILNDRPDLVAACGADGVHVGQDDMPVAEARRLAGPEALVGLSTHSREADRGGLRGHRRRPSRPDQRRPGVGDADQGGPAGHRTRADRVRRRARRRSPGSRSAASMPRTSPRWRPPARADRRRPRDPRRRRIPAAAARGLREALGRASGLRS